MGSLSGSEEEGSLRLEKLTERQAQMYCIAASAWLAWKTKGSCYAQAVQQDDCLLANHQITFLVASSGSWATLAQFSSPACPSFQLNILQMRMQSPSGLCTLPLLFLWKDVSPFRLRQENKALLSLLHSSPLSPVWERECHAAYVMKRKDNVILLYGYYDYYFIIIIIFYSGF